MNRLSDRGSIPLASTKNPKAEAFGFFIYVRRTQHHLSVSSTSLSAMRTQMNDVETSRKRNLECSVLESWPPSKLIEYLCCPFLDIITKIADKVY